MAYGNCINYKAPNQRYSTVKFLNFIIIFISGNFRATFMRFLSFFWTFLDFTSAIGTCLIMTNLFSRTCFGVVNVIDL